MYNKTKEIYSNFGQTAGVRERNVHGKMVYDDEKGRFSGDCGEVSYFADSGASNPKQGYRWGESD